MSQRLRTTSRTELIELAAAGTMLVCSRILLALVGSRRAWGIIGFISSRPKRESPIEPARVAHLTQAANARCHLGFTCLPVATATWARLRRHGYLAELRIGAPRDSSNDFEAHAWVELGGVPVGEPADLGERYDTLGDPVTGRR